MTYFLSMYVHVLPSMYIWRYTYPGEKWNTDPLELEEQVVSYKLPVIGDRNLT